MYVYITLTGFVGLLILLWFWIIVAGLQFLAFHLPILVEARPVATPCLINPLFVNNKWGIRVVVKIILSIFDGMIGEHFV